MSSSDSFTASSTSECLSADSGNETPACGPRCCSTGSGEATLRHSQLMLNGLEALKSNNILCDVTLVAQGSFNYLLYLNASSFCRC